jgi:hypothetical protein
MSPGDGVQLLALLLLVACSPPPSLESLPEPRVLADEPGGIDAVAAGELGVAWKTSTTISRWRRQRDDIESLPRSHPAHALVVGRDRVTWAEREVGQVVSWPASGDPDSWSVPEAVFRPLLEVDGQVVIGVEDGVGRWLGRIDPATGGLTRFASVPLVPHAVSLAESFAVFSETGALPPTAFTLTREQLVAGEGHAVQDVGLAPWRLFGPLLTDGDFYWWLDPGEEEIPPRLRRNMLATGDKHVVADLPSGVSGPVITVTGDVWLRAPHALIRVGHDLSFRRWHTDYDPIILAADLDGLAILAAGPEGRATRVLLQPYPFD